MHKQRVLCFFISVEADSQKKKKKTTKAKLHKETRLKNSNRSTDQEILEWI
jgi:hypothetical protein